MVKDVRGRGRKRPLVDVHIDRLHLDPLNPRLAEEYQGKDQFSLIEILYRNFNLDELAGSLAENGYFDEEPLVGIPTNLPNTIKISEGSEVTEVSKDYLEFIKSERAEFTVVEGNRRLSTCKLLLNLELRKKLGIRKWPELTKQVAHDLEILPAIIYQQRSEVVPYLGVRHIVGIQKWDSYAKATYIANMAEENGIDFDEIQSLLSDSSQSARKSYLAYRILDHANADFSFDTRQAKERFSLLMLALGQRPIKEFLGIPRRYEEVNFDNPVPREKSQNMLDLLTWIYGDREKIPVIHDSRDITNYLSHVVENPDATEHLRRTRNLSEAYDRSDGEETMLIKYLHAANLRLESALGILHRHITPDIKELVKTCFETIKRMIKTTDEEND